MVPHMLFHKLRSFFLFQIVTSANVAENERRQLKAIAKKIEKVADDDFEVVFRTNVIFLKSMCNPQ